MASIRVSRGAAIVIALGALGYLAYMFFGVWRSHKAADDQHAIDKDVDAIAKKRTDLEASFKTREGDAILRCMGEAKRAFTTTAPDLFAVTTTAPSSPLPATRPIQIDADHAAAANFDVFVTTPLLEGKVDCFPTYPDDAVATRGDRATVERQRLANIEARVKALDAMHPSAVVSGYDVRCTATPKQCEAVLAWISTTDHKLVAAIHVRGKPKANGDVDGVALGQAIKDVLAGWAVK